MLAPILGLVAIIAVSYLPNMLYDLHHGLAQSHPIADFLATADEPGRPSLPARLFAVFRRVLAWPVSGTAESAPLSGWLTVLLTAAALLVTVRGRGIARQFGWWAVATTVWAALALAVIAPTLATPFTGLPTDQYHTWLDPILFAAIGCAAARLWTAGTSRYRSPLRHPSPPPHDRPSERRR